MLIVYSILCSVVDFRVVVFFFQAEDGIRDLVRSRGLGDVYKRQVGNAPVWLSDRGDDGEFHVFATVLAPVEELALPPVSYTHLTLPTSDLV